MEIKREREKRQEWSTNNKKKETERLRDGFDRRCFAEQSTYINVYKHTQSEARSTKKNQEERSDISKIIYGRLQMIKKKAKRKLPRSLKRAIERKREEKQAYNNNNKKLNILFRKVASLAAT